MDKATGKIYVDLESARRDRVKEENLLEMGVAPTPRQISRGRVSRNEPCSCGSGKKFKRCCLKRSYP